MTSKPRKIVCKQRDEKFTALALVYGRIEDYWADRYGQLFTKIPNEFKLAVVSIFSTGEVGRLGFARIARDYAHWQRQQDEKL